MVYAQIKNFFEHLNEIDGKISQKDVFLFLDYDGTLTPIVDTPDKAVLSEENRQLIKELSQKYITSIVSGRATEDVRQKVGVKNIFYAGSHGFEIIDRQGNNHPQDQAVEIQATVNDVFNALKEKLSDINGALVEHVKYTVTAHYRLVAEEDVERFKSIVENVVKPLDNVRLTEGKKVIEVRPDIDWHKGKAVEWILKAVNFDQEKAVAIYIGDDTTDEDAFKTVDSIGFGVVVEKESNSEAQYGVTDTDEVKEVLKYFINRADK